MHFGVDYYPEHWDEGRWEDDLRAMREMHFNIVRVGEFAWSRFEPEEGKYDVGWLDRFLALCAKHRLDVMLGVPARNVPAWLMVKDPSAAILAAEGHRESFGSRYTTCLNNPTLRHHALLLAEQLAARYGARPEVSSWHLDNEYGDGSLCHCENCRRRFIAWLQARYSSPDAVNRAWGLVFWSLEIHDWEQVWLPRKINRFPHNPGLLLDFRRFCSWATEEFVAAQAAAVRTFSPGKPITTNLQSMTRYHTDYYRLTKPLDVASMNFYPPESYTTADLDIVRGTKNRSFWVVEQKAGPPGFAHPGFLTPKPGETRLYTYASIAHGADAILYFRFRPCPYGQEQYHMGIMSYDGSRNRIFREIQRMGDEMTRLAAAIEGTVVRNEVAFLHSYENRWALEQYQVHPDLAFRSFFLDYYREFERRHIGVDVVEPHADLSLYRLVVVPLLCLMDEETVDAIAAYVRCGGSLLYTTRSGVKDVHNTIVPTLIPPGLKEVLGIGIEEAFALKPGQRNGIITSDGRAYQVSSWIDLVRPEGAEVLARYTGDWYQGEAAVTRNHYGEGWAHYIGTIPDKCYLEVELSAAVALAGVTPVLDCPRTLWALKRTGPQGDVLFVLNPTERAEIVSVQGARYRDLLNGSEVSRDFTLAPYDVRVLAMQGADAGVR
jgi:beta-galactosidase